jgi:hypothetical protein
MDKRDLAYVDRSAQRLNWAAASNLSLTEIISVESIKARLQTSSPWVKHCSGHFRDMGANIIPTGVLSIQSSGVTYAQKPGFYPMSIAPR